MKKEQLGNRDIMRFGKHKGKALGDVPVSYWLWLADQSWMNEEKNAALMAYVEQRLDEEERR